MRVVDRGDLTGQLHVFGEGCDVEAYVRLQVFGKFGQFVVIAEVVGHLLDVIGDGVVVAQIGLLEAVDVEARRFSVEYIGPGREGVAVFGDASGDTRDLFDGVVFADAPSAELFEVVDGPLFGGWFAGAVKDVVDVALNLIGVAVSVDPGAVQDAVVVVGEAGDVDGR